MAQQQSNSLIFAANKKSDKFCNFWLTRSYGQVELTLVAGCILRFM